MDLSSALDGISLLQLALIATMALGASVIGGVSGYGTGALMPLILVPIVGPEPVVPMLAISALLNNSSRAGVFRHLIDWRRVIVMLPTALPATMLGAWGYTLLTGRSVLFIIGCMMMGSVPLRRLLKRRGFGLSDRNLAFVSVGWGFIAGSTTGAGIILLSLLMAAGLEGAAVIATDAIISIGMGMAKVTVFGLAGAVHTREVVLALIMGVMAFPGALLARTMVNRMPLYVHTALLDGVVIVGGAVMLWGAFTR